jgi:hypothetical protein
MVKQRYLELLALLAVAAWVSACSMPALDAPGGNLLAAPPVEVPTPSLNAPPGNAPPGVNQQAGAAPAVEDGAVPDENRPLEDNPQVVWYSGDGFEYYGNGVFCAGQAAVSGRIAGRKVALACSDGSAATVMVQDYIASEGNGTLRVNDRQPAAVAILSR